MLICILIVSFKGYLFSHLFWCSFWPCPFDFVISVVCLHFLTDWTGLIALAPPHPPPLPSLPPELTDFFFLKLPAWLVPYSLPPPFPTFWFIYWRISLVPPSHAGCPDCHLQSPAMPNCLRPHNPLLLSPPVSPLPSPPLVNTLSHRLSPWLLPPNISTLLITPFVPPCLPCGLFTPSLVDCFLPPSPVDCSFPPQMTTPSLSAPTPFLNSTTV